jgi:uncharacterized membrane protein YkvA (DUF1232 family)
MGHGASLSAALIGHLQALRQTPPRTPDELRRLVTAHQKRAEQAAVADPFVDLARATQVADACLALLDALPTLPDDHRSWVAAACLYFVDEDDEEDDFASIVGFDDDAEVVTYVADRLGLPHLKIDLD